MAEADLRAMAKEAGFSIANMTFALTDDGQSFEYHMGIKTLNPGNLHMLSERLKGESSVVEFRITPVGA
jgi:putative Mg2+ transporter-C (MgtC) family protein